MSRTGRRLGYRGAALLICGAGWTTYGAGLLADPRFGITRGVTALTHIAPMCVWGWVWVASGVLCAAAAPLPSRRDWWGWAMASAMPAVWAVAYTTARALGTLAQGWYSGVTWAVFPGLLAILAVATRRVVYLSREVARLRLAAAQRQEGAHG
ncbi:hypothetical protein [Actinacidiphila reveromycinica]|uniref:hypothetical protein n=1 Tax=Actinacidiphila reveromycinica TaxID=659352 RepID=UPI0019221844|nr:hypothetical protein [Streptomyces sp. SN-593]